MKKHSMLLALITCAGLAPTIPTHASPQTVHALGYVSAGALFSISAERLISLVGSERKYMQLKRILASKTSSERDKAITRLVLSSVGITVAVIIALITGRYHVMQNRAYAQLKSQPIIDPNPKNLPKGLVGPAGCTARTISPALSPKSNLTPPSEYDSDNADETPSKLPKVVSGSNQHSPSAGRQRCSPTEASEQPADPAVRSLTAEFDRLAAGYNTTKASILDPALTTHNSSASSTPPSTAKAETPPTDRTTLTPTTPKHDRASAPTHVAGAAPIEESTTAASTLDTTMDHHRQVRSGVAFAVAGLPVFKMGRAKSADSPRTKTSCFTVPLNGSLIVATPTGSTESSPSSTPSASPDASPIRAGAGSGAGAATGISTLGSPTIRSPRFERSNDAMAKQQRRRARRAASATLIQDLSKLALECSDQKSLLVKNGTWTKKLIPANYDALVELATSTIPLETFKTILIRIHQMIFPQRRTLSLAPQDPHQTQELITKLLTDALEEWTAEPITATDATKKQAKKAHLATLNNLKLIGKTHTELLTQNSAWIIKLTTETREKLLELKKLEVPRFKDLLANIHNIFFRSRADISAFTPAPIDQINQLLSAAVASCPTTDESLLTSPSAPTS
ncbi:MAG: hypothetical protein WCJ17_04115 [bacterium]